MPKIVLKLGIYVAPTNGSNGDEHASERQQLAAAADHPTSPVKFADRSSNDALDRSFRWYTGGG